MVLIDAWHQRHLWPQFQFCQLIYVSNQFVPCPGERDSEAAWLIVCCVSTGGPIWERQAPITGGAGVGGWLRGCLDELGATLHSAQSNATKRNRKRREGATHPPARKPNLPPPFICLYISIPIPRQDNSHFPHPRLPDRTFHHQSQSKIQSPNLAAVSSLLVSP